MIKRALLVLMAGWAGAVQAAVAPNDNIATPTQIASIPVMAPINLGNATSSATDPGFCDDPTDPIFSTLWYAFAPAQTESVDAWLDLEYAPYAAIYKGQPGALQLVDCQHGTNPTHNRARATLEKGTQYFIVAASLDEVSGSTPGILHVEPTPWPVTGQIMLGSTATLSKSVYTDIEPWLTIKFLQHIALPVTLTCPDADATIQLHVSIEQDGLTFVGDTQRTCSQLTAGTTVSFSAPRRVVRGSLEYGTAYVTLTASEFASNYSAQVDAVPVTLQR